MREGVRERGREREGEGGGGGVKRVGRTTLHFRVSFTSFPHSSFFL